MTSYPAQRRIERRRRLDCANEIKEMAAKGEPIYADAEEEHVTQIPPNAISGRTATHGKTFCGIFNPLTGEIRIDCAEEPTFWLKIDLTQTEMWFQPGAPGQVEAAARATQCAESMLFEPPTTQTNVQQPLTWQEKLRARGQRTGPPPVRQ